MSEPVKRYYAESVCRLENGKYVDEICGDRFSSNPEKSFVPVYLASDYDVALAVLRQCVGALTACDSHFGHGAEYVRDALAACEHELADAKGIAQANIARAEKAEAALAALKARCEGMREAMKLILPLAKGYAAAHPVGSNQRYIEVADAVLAFLPIVGLVERVAGELFAYVMGDDIDRTSSSLREEYMTEAAKIIRLIGGTR